MGLAEGGGGEAEGKAGNGDLAKALLTISLTEREEELGESTEGGAATLRPVLQVSVNSEELGEEAVRVDSPGDIFL